MPNEKQAGGRRRLWWCTIVLACMAVMMFARVATHPGWSLLTDLAFVAGSGLWLCACLGAGLLYRRRVR